MAEADKAYIFRPYKLDDIPFIQSSWGNSYFKGSNASKLGLNPEDFHSFHRPIRERFLQRPTAAIIVCESKTEPLTILGWIAVERLKWSQVNTILHYIYIKQAVKSEKIATELLHSVIIDPFKNTILYTHKTEKAERILKKEHYRNFWFTPHLI